MSIYISFYMYTYMSKNIYLCYMFLCYKWAFKNIKVIHIVLEEDIDQLQ